MWPKPELIVPAALVGSLLFALALALALELEVAPRGPSLPRVPRPARPRLRRPQRRPPRVAELGALVAARAPEFARDQVIEWEAYVEAMRAHASPDAPLPAGFEPLVDDVFSELFRRPRQREGRGVKRG